MISTEPTNQNTLFHMAIFSSDTRVSKTAFSDRLIILVLNRD